MFSQNMNEILGYLSDLEDRFMEAGEDDLACLVYEEIFEIEYEFRLGLHK